MLPENVCPWPQTLTVYGFFFLLGSSSTLPASLSFSSRLWQKVFPSSSSYNFPSKSVLVRRCLTSIFLNRNSTSRFTRPQRRKVRPAIRENLHLTRSVSLVDRVYKQSCEVSHTEHGTYPAGFSLRSLGLGLYPCSALSPLFPLPDAANRAELKSANEQ